MAKKEVVKEKIITTHICVWCGKEFTSEDRRRRKFCSEECRKAHHTNYNTTYIVERRKNDENFLERSRKASASSSLKYYAKGKWNSCLAHADTILKLSQMKDNKILIAKYIDQNFVSRADGFKKRSFETTEEEKASNVLDSLGDAYLTSN